MSRADSREPVLEIDRLHVRFSVFEGFAHVINGISLHIDSGEKLALVGESGCGKSVTARAVLGLINPKRTRLSGSIRYAGMDLIGLPKSRWKSIRGSKISMIFQDPSAALNPVFTIGDQMTNAIMRGGSANSRRSALELAGDMLDKVSIHDPDRVLASYPFQLSGGLNQRVLIAMALVNRPDLLIADEPGTALDVTVQMQTLQLMSSLARENNTAILLITHNLGVVREFTERVCVMYGGSIVEEASTSALFDNPRHPYTQALIKAVPRLSEAEMPIGIDGEVPNYVTPPGGCRFRPRCTLSDDRCRKPVEFSGSPDHRVACIHHDRTGSAMGRHPDG